MITNETTFHTRPNDTKLIKKGHRTPFNNKQSPYPSVSYKRFRMTHVRHLKRKN